MGTPRDQGEELVPFLAGLYADLLKRGLQILRILHRGCESEENLDLRAKVRGVHVHSCLLSKSGTTLKRRTLQVVSICVKMVDTHGAVCGT